MAEIDADIASKVMRWDVIDFFFAEKAWKSLKFPVVVRTDGKLNVWDSRTRFRVWSPSTDIANAWEIVEHFESDKNCDWRVTIELNKFSSIVYIDRECGEEPELFVAEAETVCLAICDSALKAVASDEHSPHAFSVS